MDCMHHPVERISCLSVIPAFLFIDYQLMYQIIGLGYGLLCSDNSGLLVFLRGAILPGLAR
jgi:hypothetical protein